MAPTVWPSCSRRITPWRTQHDRGTASVSGRRRRACSATTWDGRWRSVPRPRFDEFQTPALAIGLYDVVLAIDHVLDRAWIISQGFPEVDPAARRRRAAERLAQFRGWLDGTRPIPPRRPARTPLRAARTTGAAVRRARARGIDQQLFGRGLSGDGAPRDRVHPCRRRVSGQHRAAAALPGPRRRGVAVLASAAPQPGHVRRLFRLGRDANRQRIARAISQGARRHASKPGRSRARGSAPRGPRPICSPATSCCRAKRIGPRT